MKQSAATSSHVISEQLFVAEQKKRMSQKKVVLDDVDLEPFELYEFTGKTYLESPGDLTGDSADDALAEILMGLSFRSEDDDELEDTDDEDISPSGRWTDAG